jgi:threonyl-tRNA synthetase
MKYLVISKKGKIFNAYDFLKKEKHEEEFNRFVRREAFDEVLIEKADKRPAYLEFASRLGFNWEQNAGLGLVQYDYKAFLIMQLVKEYARSLVQGIGFPIYEMQGSNMFDASHPVVEAYAKLYGERLFRAGQEKKDLIMGYDASYPQFNLAGKYKFHKKDLPFAHFSISDCYRYEQSGECMMFYRQRRFFMPDLHPYFKDIEEAFEWYPKIEKQILEGAKSVNRKYQVVVEVSSQENFDKYQDHIIKIAKNLKQDILIGVHEDNKDRYWIINADYKIIDKLGHAREIACIQIDVGNAERLNINYIDEKDQKHNPIIIHSAVPGGIERFLYMVFDDFKNCMPLWLYPVQLRLIPVNDKCIAFCENIAEMYRDKVRVDIDDRAESVGKKMRDGYKALIPFQVVIGEKEMVSGELIELEKVIEMIVENGDGKPFLKLSWPRLVSGQIS